MAETETESLVLNVKQVAKLLQCSERTVWKLRERGELRAVKVMGRVKFSRDDVNEFVNGRTSQA